MNAINYYAFPIIFHILNSIQTADKNYIFSLIYQLLSISNSNANFIHVDIGFFKKIFANTITLWKIVKKAITTMILKNVNLIKDNLNDNHL